MPNTQTLFSFIFFAKLICCLNGYSPYEILPELNTTTTAFDTSLMNGLHTKPPTPIEPSCMSYYSYLAKLGAQFTQCVVDYSRPFRVCENCLRYYMEIVDAKKLIKNVRITFFRIGIHKIVLQ